MNLLAIVAHPTDAFDLIGGTLANHVEAGDEVHVCFTHSRIHDDAFRLADRIREGQAQADAHAIEEESLHHIERMRAACEILGIENISTIDHTGEAVTFSGELVGLVATRIQQVRPQLLITHNPLENAGVTPHAVCGQLALEGMRLAWGARDNGLDPHRIAQLYLICVPGSTSWLDASTVNRYPAVLIDVERQVEKKVRALSLLDSQNYTLEMAAKLVEVTSGVASIHQRVAYAEQFQPYFPEVHDTLPVCRHHLQVAEELYRDGARRLRFTAPWVPGVRGDREDGTDG